MKVFDDGLVNDDEKVAQLPITQFTIRVKNSYPIGDQNDHNRYPVFLTKTAENPGPFWPHFPIWPIKGSTPRGC